LTNLNSVALLGVDKLREVTLGGVEEGLEAEVGQRLRQLKRLVDLELGQLHVQVINLKP
jgi:hypothetical protein